MFECVRMQPTPVDFDAKQFFKPHVAEMNLPAKVVEQGELAWLVGSFERYCFETEHRHKSVGIRGVQVAVVIEEPDSSGALSGFDNQLHSAGIEPLLTAVDPLSKSALIETTVVLLAQFHLNIKTTASRCRRRSASSA